MYLSDLSLLDFRSYPAVDVAFEPGPNVLVGRNGQGKTNLVEAVGYAATLGSHRVSADAPLIRAGAERAVVRARVVKGDRASVVELEIASGRTNRARINRGSWGRARDVLGIVKAVVFAPEDLALVKGDPDVRRRFMDSIVVQLVPRAAGVMSDYERVVRQRSALLKSLRQVGPSARAAGGATLDVWDERAADLGAQLVSLRREVTMKLTQPLNDAYGRVSRGGAEATMVYRPALFPTRGEAYVDNRTTGVPATEQECRAQLAEAFATSRSREIERGTTLIGPHRDELEFRLGDLPAKGYASHGESWSFALALRLASLEVLGSSTPLSTTTSTGVPGACRGADGVGGSDVENSVDAREAQQIWSPLHNPDADPILVLDDVFAELDVQRRNALAELIMPLGQVLITAAVAEDVPQQLSTHLLHVSTGRVDRG